MLLLDCLHYCMDEIKKKFERISIYRKVTKERKSGAEPLLIVYISFDVVLITTNML